MNRYQVKGYRDDVMVQGVATSNWASAYISARVMTKSGHYDQVLVIDHYDGSVKYDSQQAVSTEAR